MTNRERGRRRVLGKRIAQGLPVVAAGLLLSGWLNAAAAQTAADPMIEERFAFDAADTDADGRVSEAELARDAARGFASLDKDGNGSLSPAELGAHDAAQFARVDANGDGSLSFSEVMRHKVQALGMGDKDADGGLSFEEMVAAVEAETGAKP